MVIDTSAFVAIAFQEPEAETFAEQIDKSAVRLMSAVSWVGLSVVVRARLGDEAEARVMKEVRNAGIEVIPVDAEQAELARQAFAIYGKGRHAAGLNFGDCFAYALARAHNLPLLYKGADFAKTDIDAAIF